jgi:amidase
MTPLPEYDTLDALALADLIRRGELSAAEVLAAARARIAARNPALNAVVQDMGEAAEAAVAAGLPDGPFRGVPYVVKDLYTFCAGARCGNGSRLFDGFVAAEDVEVVRRYRHAGLVIAGRTNTPEFGLSVSTEPAAGGATRNPWDRSRSAGGSSGGSAAAVAAGMVPMAHGSDGGGSIRIPAACCGVFGLKPTRDRVTFGPIAGEAWSGLATQHALTRSVRDSAALLDASAGPLVGDPHVAPRPNRPFLDFVGADVGRLRIGVSLEAPGATPVAADCRAAAEAAAGLIAELGHEVEPVALPYDRDEVVSLMLTLVAANTAFELSLGHPVTRRPIVADDVEPLSWAFAEHGRGLSAADYVGTVYRMHAIGRRFASLFESCDAWLSPALAGLPPALGHFATGGSDIVGFGNKVFDYTPFTMIANISGHPAAAVPFDVTDSGLPVGVQITGRFGDEGTLLALAGQIEAARPWAHRRPTLRG